MQMQQFEQIQEDARGETLTDNIV